MVNQNRLISRLHPPSLFLRLGPSLGGTALAFVFIVALQPLLLSIPSIPPTPTSKVSGMLVLSYAERARLAQPKDDDGKSAQKQDHNTIMDQIHSQPSTNPGSSATSTTGTLTSSPPLSAHPQLPTPNIPGLLSSPSSSVDTKHSIDTNHPNHPSAQDPPAPLSQPKHNAWTARKQPHMASVIPQQKQLNGYVQQPAITRPTTIHHADHSRLPPPSSFSSSINKQPDSDFGSTNHSSLPPLNDPDNWPEMGKVVASTSSHRSRQSVTSLLSPTMVSGTQNSIIDPSAIQENPAQADEPASVKKPKGEPQIVNTHWSSLEIQATLCRLFCHFPMATIARALIAFATMVISAGASPFLPFYSSDLYTILMLTYVRCTHQARKQNGNSFLLRSSKRQLMLRIGLIRTQTRVEQHRDSIRPMSMDEGCADCRRKIFILSEVLRRKDKQIDRLLKRLKR